MSDHAPQPALACIALGANLGDRAASIERALAMLDALEGVRILRRSTLHATAPVTRGHDAPPQPEYLNAAAAIETTLQPRALLDAMLAIERAIGRDRAGEERWGPRLIDLDLLLYADAVIDEDGLRVPHPRMHERRFVLAPLAEVAPNETHPTLGRRVRELLDAIRDAESAAGAEG
ncbi:MAG: 2-amino-4-hydroxy-6-hydroxymethyldihydropteridine diphosphokinase [Phycisphaerales bacterium]|nr:MAG: 2-amino-4-hydroxy-6-hydroxymethyldihydropteridine diphosphokinase [Phycisphaerales bacterium]